ncbi:transporter [Kitasatospora sp. NPDC048365]|uniref:transporter n=1 Tax=Kitasatospora sp. NPDC048365 TaxID=3364050 RepID=UPI0037123AFF
MIWLTWRQFRAPALVTALALALLAAALGATRAGLAHDYTAGLAACTGQAEGCTAGFLRKFFDAHQLGFLAVSAVVLVVPALIGLFWGAPLIARELEAGTLRLVWNQSLTRSRWLAVKLGLTCAAATAAAGLVSLAGTWWAGPLDRAAVRDFVRMAPLAFGTRGVAPVGYAVFAFVLGVTVGLLLRRTLPAMVVTLAVFAAVQVLVPTLVRPHLMTPLRATGAITAADIDGLRRGQQGDIVMLAVSGPEPGAWVLSSGSLDSRSAPVGEVVVPEVDGTACAPDKDPEHAMECLARLVTGYGYRKQVTYQPADRFWAFQWIETAGYLAVSGGLAGFCFWWIRRRRGV